MARIKHVFTILLILTNCMLGLCQVDTSITFNSVSYNCFIIEVDSINLSKIRIMQNFGDLNHKDFIEEYIANHEPHFFATNACVNDKTGKPLGLFISNSQEISPLNTDDGVGNFFLKPNGALLLKNDDAFVLKSEIVHRHQGTINAIQSGPMLIIDDTINTSFNQNSNNKNLRCGVGIFTIKNTKYLIFSLSNEPVTFFEFALLFKQFRCHNALCLESGNSVMYTPKNANNLPINKVVGNYIVYSKTSTPKSHNTIQMVKSKSGIYELPVELNGVLKISFIFDPGASDVSISPDVALTLIRTGTISDRDFIGTQKYSFADGSTAVSNVFILHEVKIGGYRIKNVRVSISNSLNAPMLLGQSVMQRMGKFTVNNTDHTLTID